MLIPDILILILVIMLILISNILTVIIFIVVIAIQWWVGGRWIWATGRCSANGAECKIGEAITTLCNNATCSQCTVWMVETAKWEEFPKKGGSSALLISAMATPFISTALFFSSWQHHHHWVALKRGRYFDFGGIMFLPSFYNTL